MRKILNSFIENIMMNPVSKFAKNSYANEDIQAFVN